MKFTLLYSRTPLFRTRLIRSPRYFERKSNSLGFTLMFSVIYYQLFRIPRYFNSSFFPCTLNQPRYFELVKSRVQEQTPKRPTKSEVRQEVETLSRYSLLAIEGAENRGQTSQLSFSIDKSIRKKPKPTEHSKIFQCNS